MMKHNRILLVWPALAMLVAAAPARAWHGKGHYDATKLAMRACRADANLPDFFTAPAGTATVAHCSLDPDNFTRPIAPDSLHRAESPEHYFDVELLGANRPLDANFPPNRQAFFELCRSRRLTPGRIGLAPYAVTEWTHRLTVAFAEHRKYPRNAAIRAKCLVYAGLLAHYAADLCQPLHTTIHYDGRAGANGKSPHSGIHAKTDALLGKLIADADTPPAWPRRDANDILAGIRPAVLGPVMPAVLARLRKTHALVDHVYKLEKLLPTETEPIAADSPVERFAIERMRASAGLIASLYVTAWRNSADIKLPWWHARPYHSPQTKPPARKP